MSYVRDKFRRDSFSLLLGNQWSRNLCIERKVSMTHQHERLCWSCQSTLTRQKSSPPVSISQSRTPNDHLRNKTARERGLIKDTMNKGTPIVDLGYTIEPHLMATQLKRPTCYYGHFILVRTKPHSVIFYFKNPLNFSGHSVNTARFFVLARWWPDKQCSTVFLCKTFLERYSMGA